MPPILYRLDIIRILVAVNRRHKEKYETNKRQVPQRTMERTELAVKKGP